MWEGEIGCALPGDTVHSRTHAILKILEGVVFGRRRIGSVGDDDDDGDGDGQNGHRDAFAIFKVQEQFYDIDAGAEAMLSGDGLFCTPLHSLC